MIPADLLRDVAAANGRLTFVIGAGCSFEQPTGLPLAGDCAEQLHTQLVADGVLGATDCAEPRNLEAVADAVLERGGNKGDIVSRLPRESFCRAQPNGGHKVLAVLLAERVVSSVLTINYDLAVENALRVAGIHEVARIARPEDHREFGSSAVVYLHGAADAPEAEWFLTSAEVESGWDKGWGEVVAGRVLAAPAIVFAGIGTMVGVLRATMNRIQAALPAEASIFCVDPSEHAESLLAGELSVPKARYVQAGWCDFAAAIGNRLFEDQVRELEAAVGARIEELHGIVTDAGALIQAVRRGGLLLLGEARAAWFLRSGTYLPWRVTPIEWSANLMVAIAAGAAALQGTVELRSNGTVAVSRQGRRVATIGCVHGSGTIRAGALEVRVRQARKAGELRQDDADVFLVAGLEGLSIESIATPRDLVRAASGNDIIHAPSSLRFLHVDQVTDDPTRFAELVEWPN